MRAFTVTPSDGRASLVERWPDVVQSLISQRWPLSEAARLLDDPPPGVKHVVTLTD